MKDLYLSEVTRFRNAALIALGLNLLALLLLNQLCDPLQLRGEFTLAILVLYMLLSAGLGLYQFGTYRHSARWVWLLHRPLSRLRIFGAIALASATLLAIAFMLPLLLVVTVSEITGRVVDLRHHLLPLALLLFCLIAWHAGVCIILSRSQTAFVIAALPFLLLFHPAAGPVLLLPTLLCLALLAATAFVHFKPNRLAPPAAIGALLLVALPLFISTYFVLLWAGAIGFQSAQILLGIHPLNREVPPAGGYTEAIRARGSALMGMGLASSTVTGAALWRREAALREPMILSPDLKRYPVSQALINQDDSGWDDASVGWTFSHDDMRFVGRDRITGRRTGTIGPDGGFESPPVLRHAGADAILLATPHQLYQYERATGLRPLVALPAREVLTSFPVVDGTRAWLLTTRHLLRFDTSAATGPWSLSRAVLLPRGLTDLARVDVLPLLDGTLVSFLSGRHMVDGVGAGEQVVQFADEAGHAIEVARRPLTHDFPALFEHRAWWFSPSLHALVALPSELLSAGGVADPEQRTPWYARPRPPIAWVAAALNVLLAAVGGWWWLRGTALPFRLRTFWLGSCATVGLPALCTLAILQPRCPPPRPAAAPADPVPSPS